MTEKVLGDLWADWLPVGSLVAMAACITHLRFFIYLIRSARWAVLSPLLLIAHHNGLLDASLLDPCPALIGVHHLEHYNDVWDTNALCGYPLVKMELEIQTRFLPRLPFSCNSIISDKKCWFPKRGQSCPINPITRGTVQPLVGARAVIDNVSGWTLWLVLLNLPLPCQTAWVPWFIWST